MFFAPPSGIRYIRATLYHNAEFESVLWTTLYPFNIANYASKSPHTHTLQIKISVYI